MSNKISDKELGNILNGRILIYEVLIYLLSKAPEKDGLIEISQNIEFKELGKISKGAELINDYLANISEEKIDRIIKSTQEEYQRLFVGPTPIQVPIWESVYFDPEKLMFGERTLKVRKFYKKYNLEFIRKNKEPEDHLAIELEFILFLIKKTLETKNDDEIMKLIEDQIIFLDNHLLTWNDMFSELLFNKTENILYKGVALLIREFLAIDRETLTMIKEGLENERFNE